MEIHTLIMHIIRGHDITEIYSPRRVVEIAEKMGLQGGLSMDITTKDDAGNYWDFNDVKMREKARNYIIKNKPLLLIGSPMCTAYSILQKMNYPTPKSIECRRQADVHMKFVSELYELQIKEGRYFLHEHPWHATSWQLPFIQKIMNQHGTYTVKGSMCQFGMIVEGSQGRGLARKDTGFMTNSFEIANRLNRPCNNTPNLKTHEHIILLNGISKQAQRYPRKLCEAICNGLIMQKKADETGMSAIFCLSNVEIDGKIEDTIHEDEGEIAYDDVSGQPLDPAQVRRARAEEIEYFKKHGVYVKVPISRCWQLTGKAPIKVRWIDINKGDSINPNYRSRLVAKEINHSKSHDPELFAATPPHGDAQTIG